MDCVPVCDWGDARGLHFEVYVRSCSRSRGSLDIPWAACMHACMETIVLSNTPPICRSAQTSSTREVELTTTYRALGKRIGEGRIKDRRHTPSIECGEVENQPEKTERSRRDTTSERKNHEEQHLEPSKQIERERRERDTRRYKKTTNRDKERQRAHEKKVYAIDWHEHKEIERKR